MTETTETLLSNMKLFSKKAFLLLGFNSPEKEEKVQNNNLKNHNILIRQTWFPSSLNKRK